MDYGQVARDDGAASSATRGGEIRTGRRRHAPSRRDGDGLVLETASGEVHARHLVNCAGLHSDRVARMMGVEPEVRIVPSAASTTC